MNTQIQTGKGRPDLEIRSPHRLAWIEVKAEPALRAGQLEGYRILLGRAGVAETRLILLTRYPETIKLGDERPDLEVRWFQVADWLEGELAAAHSASDIGGFLVLQLLNFLEVRGMTLTQVGKFMPEGLRALSSLMNMLFEAASACGVSVKRVPEWDAIGFYLDGRKYWVGVIYNDSAYLTFKTNLVKIDMEAALNLGVGELDEEVSWVPGRQRWMRWVELDSEEIHFYSRSKLSQMQWLEEFLRDCLFKARSIESPDQPLIPEVTREDS